MSPEAPLICLNDLTKSFGRSTGLLGGKAGTIAVNDVSLCINKGEVLGVVGESGSGKSTLGRIAVGMLVPDSGDVRIQSKPLYDKSAHADYKAFRRSLAGTVQMVFQDPYSSLNPRMRVGSSIAEPLICSHAWRDHAPELAAMPVKQAIRHRVGTILAQVGLDADAGNRYPHEFSGGQRQRIAIARALVTRPAFVVCDEPTSSLDASVQSQVLNLLRDMLEELELTYMFISHDLAVVRYMSDKVAVMYHGYLVEEGDADALFRAPRHPYTRLLLDSVPGATGFDDQEVEGSPVMPEGRPASTGCPFQPRCPIALAECGHTLPSLTPVDPGQPEAHRVRCIVTGSGKEPHSHGV